MYNQPVTVLGTGDTAGNFFNFYFFWWLLHMSKEYAYGAVDISHFDIVYWFPAMNHEDLAILYHYRSPLPLSYLNSLSMNLQMGFLSLFII